MSSIPRKKRKTAGRSGSRARRRGIEAPEVVAASAPTAAVLVLDPTLASFLRLRADPRLPRLNNAPFPEGVVEYEVVSEETLRGITEEQAGRLIHLLERRDVYDDDDDEVNNMYRPQDCAVWLSPRCFMRRGAFLRATRNPPNLCKLECRYYRSRSPGRQIDLVDAEESNPHPPIQEADAMLFILGRHSGIHEFWLASSVADESFPVSAAALQEFVRTVPQHRPPAPVWRNTPGPYIHSPMRVRFRCGRLSDEHKRVLAYGCHRELHVNVNLGCWDSGSGVELLLDAVRRNLCPTRLAIRDARRSHYHHLKAVFEALQSNTCVEALHLELDEAFRDVEFRKVMVAPLLRLLSGNRNLRYLHLARTKDLLKTSWILFWRAVASHPTLQVLDLSSDTLSNCLESQLEHMSQRLYESKSLQFLHTSRDEHIDQIPIVRDKVLPILQLNRFRTKVEALLNEPDRNQRQKGFWQALMNDEDVRNTPTLIFYLLTEATDLFVQRVSGRVEGSGVEE